jgi:hypothetical protein
MATPSRRGSIAAGFGLAWLVVNGAGWGLGFGLQFIVIHSGGPGGLVALFGTLVAAGVIGLAQWLALRWLIQRMRPGSQGIAWTILTIFGFTAGFLAGSLISGVANETTSAAASAAITFAAWALVGLVTGGMQWLALVYNARGGGWWVAANGLGYGLGAILLAVLRPEVGNSPFAYALSGVVAGACTLVAISRLRWRSGSRPVSNAEGSN